MNSEELHSYRDHKVAQRKSGIEDYIPENHGIA
jgi:hypothetical protein